MSHHRELARHELEHMILELWALQERGRDELQALRETDRVDDVDGTLRQLAREGYIRLEGERASLTDRGRELAELQARRHRLAELLLSTVLEVGDERTVDHTACVMEHILSPSVTDSVCSFLGHPKFCPHGEPIPPGRCCRSFSNAIEPLVQPLVALAVGQQARIVYIVPKEPVRLVKLSTLGLVPGATIRLQQLRPAPVVHVGETTLALDHAIAAEIYVKKQD